MEPSGTRSWLDRTFGRPEHTLLWRITSYRLTFPRNVGRSGDRPTTCDLPIDLPTERVRHAACDRGKHLLHHIGGVMLGDTGLAAPAVDDRPKDLDKPIPAVRIHIANTLQQRRRQRGQFTPVFTGALNHS